MTLYGPTTVSDRLRLDEHSRPRWDDVLCNDRRRAVLRYVLEADDEVAVRTLVSQIADAEHDATLGSTLLEQRQRVHAALRRTHLPLLEEYGLLEYERLRGLVVPAAQLSELESALE
ncbi:DUF7344 domain-containing protein [Natronobeatus ordinarius]|uniref:DUF7344 domain-containing protein n=1 Tax=Natronobeatus ordinarius TaxID=2963433 RepID=UPI0020CED22B|nr:hypothetical protein [Natronobeatus ordinarius]